jgi:phage baseplate assembly protein W
VPDRPHFAYPFRRGSNGKVAVVEQDSTEHIMSCETLIVACPQGFRLDRPEFGIPWPEYRNTIDPGEITAAMREFEPRSRLNAQEVLDLRARGVGERTVNVEVEG